MYTHLEHGPALGRDAVAVPVHHGHDPRDAQGEPPELVLGGEGLRGHGPRDGRGGVGGSGAEGRLAEAHKEPAHSPQEHVVAVVGWGKGCWVCEDMCGRIKKKKTEKSVRTHARTHPLALARKAACVRRGSVRWR